MVPGWLQPHFQVCCSPNLHAWDTRPTEMLSPSCHCLFPDCPGLLAQSPCCSVTIWSVAVCTHAGSFRWIPQSSCSLRAHILSSLSLRKTHSHLYPVPSPGKWGLQGALAKKEAAIILITEMWLGWEGLLCLPTKHAICSSVSTSDWIYSLSER